MHLASIHWFHIFQETLKYTKEACNVRDDMNKIGGLSNAESSVPQETEETQKLLPSFY